MKLLMENWREYVTEENERVILTEEELNELLQEIGALKSFMGRMRGGKKFGDHGYGWEAAVEQWEEEDAQKAAQSLGLSGVNTKEDFKAKVQDTIKKAEKSGDARAKEAIKDLTVDIEKIEPEETTGVPEIVPEPPPENGAAVTTPEPPPVNGSGAAGLHGSPVEPPVPGQPEAPPVEPPIPGGGEDEEHVTSVPGAVVGQADKNDLRMAASMLADPYGGGRLKALGLSPEEMSAIRQLLNDWAKGMNMQLMEQFLRVLEATRFQPVDPPKARQPRRVPRQEIPQPNLQPLDLAQIYDIIEDEEKARLAAAMIAQNLERVGVRALNWRRPPVSAGEEEVEAGEEEEVESGTSLGSEEEVEAGDPDAPTGGEANCDAILASYPPDFINKLGKDESVRGELREMARSVALLADATAIASAAFAAGTAVPTAGTGAAAGVGAGITATGVGAAADMVALSMSVMLLQPKDILLDLISFIPLVGGKISKVTRKAFPKFFKASVKAGAKTTAKATAKATGNAVEQVAKKAGEDALEDLIAEQLTKTLGEEQARLFAKTTVIAGEQKARKKLKEIQASMSVDIEKDPDESEEDYQRRVKKAAKELVKQEQTELDAQLKECIRGEQNIVVRKTAQAIEGLTEFIDFLDDTLDWIMEKGASLFKGEEEEEETEYEIGKGPPGVMEPPPGEQAALQESQLKRWKELAGILHS